MHARRKAILAVWLLALVALVFTFFRGGDRREERDEPLLADVEGVPVQQRYVAGHLVESSPPGQPAAPARRVVVRGQISGVPADRVAETRVRVHLEQVTSLPALVVRTGPAADPPPDPRTVARVLPTGEYEADVSALAKGIVGEVEITVEAEHPLAVATTVTRSVRLGVYDGDAPGAQAFTVPVALQLAQELMGTVVGAGAKGVSAHVFDLTEALEIRDVGELRITSWMQSAEPTDTVAVQGDGAFRLRGARDHLLLVVVYGAGRRPAWRLVQPSPDMEASLGVFELGPGLTLEGRVVTPDFLRVESVSVREMSRGEYVQLSTDQGLFEWWDGRLQAPPRDVAVGEDGTFQVEGVPAEGRVHLIPSFVSPWVEKGLAWVDNTLRRHEPVPTTASARIEVVASLLEIHAPDTVRRDRRPRFLLGVGDAEAEAHHVPEDGQLRIAVPPDTPFRIESAPEGPACEPVEGRTPPAGERLQIPLEMQAVQAPGGVRFLLREGEVVPRADVSWTRDGYAPRHGFMYATTLKFIEGEAVLSDLPPGAYVFEVEPFGGGEGQDAGWWAGVTVEAEVRAGETSQVQVLPEEGGRWEIAVTRSDTGAFQECVAEVFDLDGKQRSHPRLVYRGEGGGDDVLRRAFVHGGNPNEALNPLPPGTYKLRCSYPDFLPDERPLVIKQRETTRVAVTLRPRR